MLKGSLPNCPDARAGNGAKRLPGQRRGANACAQTSFSPLEIAVRHSRNQEVKKTQPRAKCIEPLIQMLARHEKVHQGSAAVSAVAALLLQCRIAYLCLVTERTP